MGERNNVRAFREIRYFILHPDNLINSQGNVVQPVALYPIGGYGTPGVGNGPVRVTASTAYDAFGGFHGHTADGAGHDGAGNSAAVYEPAGFGGQFGYYHDYAGRYLLGHRFYDSFTGRFVTRDPIGYKGGINLYGFTGNNPVNESDPDGTSQDAGGGSGTIRLSWTAFIPVKNAFPFRGDNRSYSPNTPAYRLQQNIIINLRTHRVQVLAAQVGESHYTNGSSAGRASPDGMDGSGSYNSKGYNIDISGSVGVPALHGSAPPIAYHAFIHVDPTGSKISISGYHTNYPAFELWSYGVHGTHQDLGYDPIRKGYNPLTGLPTISIFKVREQPL